MKSKIKNIMKNKYGALTDCGEHKAWDLTIDSPMDEPKEKYTKICGFQGYNFTEPQDCLVQHFNVTLTNRKDKTEVVHTYIKAILDSKATNLKDIILILYYPKCHSVFKMTNSQLKWLKARGL